MSLMETILPGRKNIVILGAGFGGITALLHLYRSLKRKSLLHEYQLVVVNKSAQHLYTPALYEIAAIPKGEAGAIALKSAICIQIDDIIARYPEIKFVGETVSSLNPAKRTITFESGDELTFEYVVVALGAETNFFGISGMAELSYPLKNFDDAVRLRNRIEEIMRTDPPMIRIAIGGAGATGVELSAEFVNFICYLKERTHARNCLEEITLIEGSPEILGGFSQEVIKNARRRLLNLGVKILTNSPIERVSQRDIIFKDGRFIGYDLLVWAGGVRPASAVSRFGLTLDKRGAIVVDTFLEAAPRVYAIGDAASFMNQKTGRPLPGNIPVAEAGALVAACNITAEISSSERYKFKTAKEYPFILAVGGKYAVSDLMGIKLFGFIGWLVKQFIELRYLLILLPIKKAVAMWLRTVYYSSSND